MRKLDNKNIDHIVGKILRSLNSKLRAHSITDDPDDYSYLPEMINRHITNIGYNDVEQVCSQLFDKLPFHPTRTEEVRGVLINDLANHAILLTTEFHYYYTVPHFLPQAWYNVAVKNSIEIIPAMILLAVHVGMSTHEGLLKHQIIEMTGHDSKTVTDHLKNLETAGLINFTQKFAKEKVYQPTEKDVENIDPSSFITSPPNKCWFSSLNPLGVVDSKDKVDTVDEAIYAGYLFTKPLDVRNPFYHNTGTAYVFHKRFFHTATFAAAILTKSQINVWLKAAHGVNYRQRLQTFNKSIKDYIKREFSEQPLDDIHYEQIRKFIPLSHYIGRRAFYFNLFDVDYRIGNSKKDLEIAIEQLLIAINSVDFLGWEPSWNKNYFIYCLEKEMEPLKAWKQRYPTTGLTFPIRQPDGKQKLLTLRKEHLSDDGLDILSTLIKCGPQISQVVRFAQAHRTLKMIFLNFQKYKAPSIMSSTSLLNKKTHRHHLNWMSSQNIPKNVRPVFFAKDNHQFLIVDINSFDLEVWKVLATEDSSKASDKISDDFTFNDIAKSLKLTRNQVKLAIYISMYGGGKDRVMAETGLTEDEWKLLKSRLYKEKPLMAFKKETKAIAEETSLTLETALYHRMVLFDEHYKALSYVVQATGAEIFREWVLELKEKELAEYIVNLIHDEIIFELPMDRDLQKVFAEVQNCLNTAADKLLPRANLTIKGSACRRWDAEAAVKLHLPRLLNKSTN